MHDGDEPKKFRTLRGFLSGDEPGEANYFRLVTTLRIHGDAVPFEAIGERLGVEPTHFHRKGERRGLVHLLGETRLGILSQRCLAPNRWSVTSTRFGRSCGRMLTISSH